MAKEERKFFNKERLEYHSYLNCLSNLDAMQLISNITTASIDLCGPIQLRREWINDILKDIRKIGKTNQSTFAPDKTI